VVCEAVVFTDGYHAGAAAMSLGKQLSIALLLLVQMALHSYYRSDSHCSKCAMVSNAHRAIDIYRPSGCDLTTGVRDVEIPDPPDGETTISGVPLRYFARHSILVLTVALLTSGNLHECFFLFLIVAFLVYSFASRDYRLISVSLVLGCLTYYRLVFNPLVWSNTINASDLIRLFPWSTPPPLLNNFVKALMFLPGLGIAAVQTKGNSKARFAPIGIGIGVSGLLILSMTLQAVVIDWHALSGDIAVRTRLQLANKSVQPGF